MDVVLCGNTGTDTHVNSVPWSAKCVAQSQLTGACSDHSKLFFLPHSMHQRAAMQQLITKVFKLSFEFLHIYSTKCGDFAEKNSKIASLMSCQRSDLWRTLTYSQTPRHCIQ